MELPEQLLKKDKSAIRNYNLAHKKIECIIIRYHDISKSQYFAFAFHKLHGCM